MNNLISKAKFITLVLVVVFLPFSIRLCHLSLLLFLVCCIAESDFTNKGRIIIQNPLAWLLPLFFLLHVVGVLYSENVANAWTNVDKKIAFIVAPLIIVPAKSFTTKEIRWLCWSFVGTCLAGSITCLLDVMFRSDGDWWSRVSYTDLASGIGMHPTYLSLYCLVSVLIVFKTITNRWITATLIIYFLVFIVFLSSRIVIISTALVMLAVAIGNSRRILMIACVAIMALALFVNPVSFYRNFRQYTKENFAWPPAKMSDNPISIRMSLLWLSMKAVGETNPVIGAGTGDVNDTIAALGDKYDAHNILNTSDPHNQYLHTYIALGAMGLLTLLAVFLTPLWMLFRQKEFVVCAGIIAFMLIGMTESLLELQKGIVFCTLCVSIIGNQLREVKFKMSLTDRTDRTDNALKSVRSA
ncbi:MAG: O-antigen ligase family protein [Bacteroidota bacterium]